MVVQFETYTKNLLVSGLKVLGKFEEQGLLFCVDAPIELVILRRPRINFGDIHSFIYTNQIR